MTATAARLGASFDDAARAARAGDRRQMLTIAAQQVVCGLLPAIMLVASLRSVLSNPNTIAVDFNNAYWIAGYRLLHGGDPYFWTHAQLAQGVSFVYPALSAIVYAPFALISRGAADVVDTLICVALVPLTLWLLNVRDWRVYGIAMLGGPVFSAWQTGNETLPLMALCALVWRYRDRPVVAGVLTAVMISMKPFVWPLALWLLVTRRWRASGWALVSGLVINFAAWAVVGFGQIRALLHISGLDTALGWRGGYSVAAVAGHLGLSRHAGDLLTAVAVIALAAGVAYLGLLRRREVEALTFTIVLMLVASPLVWSHYFVLLLIPLAISRPRIGWLWLLPVAMRCCAPSTGVELWQDAIAWVMTVTIVVDLMLRAPGVRPQALARA